MVVNSKTLEAKKWISQARRGTLELCIFTLLSQEPRYGYELVAYLAKWRHLTASEGTLYPLLRRLQKEGYIAGQWRESESGPPRKYYRLTDAGHSLLVALSSEWAGLTGAVEQLQENRDEPMGANSAQAQAPASLPMDNDDLYDRSLAISGP